MQTAPSLQLVIQETKSPLRMVPHGLQGILIQEITMESPTETVPLWQWVNLELSSLLRMEPHGLQGLLVQQTMSGESLTNNNPHYLL